MAKEGFDVWVIKSADFKRQLNWANWASSTELGKRVRKAVAEDLKPAVGRFLAEQMLAVKKASSNPTDWLPIGRQGVHEITVSGFHFSVELLLAEGGILVTVKEARLAK